MAKSFITSTLHEWADREGQILCLFFKNHLFKFVCLAGERSRDLLAYFNQFSVAKADLEFRFALS
jgi:hypothetical protein